MQIPATEGRFPWGTDAGYGSGADVVSGAAMNMGTTNVANAVSRRRRSFALRCEGNAGDA
jgi:hypothetical protein